MHKIDVTGGPLIIHASNRFKKIKKVKKVNKKTAWVCKKKNPVSEPFHQ